MPELWSVQTAALYTPGLLLISALTLLLGALFSVSLANSGIGRSRVELACAVPVWISLLLYGAVPALLWHAQPVHVWLPVYLFAAMLTPTWWLPRAIKRRYTAGDRRVLTPR